MVGGAERGFSGSIGLSKFCKFLRPEGKGKNMRAIIPCNDANERDWLGGWWSVDFFPSV